MINGIGIVGWGVGGIEAEAGMLGQPVYFLTPDVVGVHLTGALKEGVTATDLALTVTQMLRKAKVVGKFVEFFGPGAAALPVVDRATIANMAPEYGATMGFFPIDAECVNYLRATGRSDAAPQTLRVLQAHLGSGAFRSGARSNTRNCSTRPLATVSPASPVQNVRRTRIELPQARRVSSAVQQAGRGNGLAENAENLTAPCASLSGQHGQETDHSLRPSRKDHRRPSESEMRDIPRPTPRPAATHALWFERQIGHGSVLIAAITSCTNTGNPERHARRRLAAQESRRTRLKVNPVVRPRSRPVRAW
jgi:aconitate hydratase